MELVGTILWWAEGTKSRLDKRWKHTRSFPVELTNTNPIVIKMFADYLREVIGVSNNKLRIQVQIHEGDERSKLEKYWSDISGVPLSQFNKTIVRPKGKKIGKTRGTCKIRFADKEIYEILEKKLVAVIDEIYPNPKQRVKMLPHYEFVFSSVKIIE